MVAPVPLKRPINWARLRPDDAERIIRERSQNTDNVIIGTHAYDRVETRTIVQEDVYWILQTGMVEGQPSLDDGEWKVIMVRRMPGTRVAGVVTLIVEENDEIFVKTVEWMDWIR
jgi:hypothetical protein